jgi:hypothetical protein
MQPGTCHAFLFCYDFCEQACGKPCAWVGLTLNKLIFSSHPSLSRAPSRYNHPTSEGLQFLYDLPRALYEEIAGHLFKSALRKISIFRGLEDAFLTSVSIRMKIVMFTPKEVIFM